MALAAEAINDLINTTLKKFDKPNWTNLTTTIQNFVALPKILKKEKVVEESGTHVEWRVQIGTSGAAQNVGLYASITPNVGNTFQYANVPWRHTTTNYSFDRREFEMNSGESRIVNLIKGRRLDAFVDLAKKVEADFWSKPASSTDVTTPYGVKYWIVYNATDGFTGGDPSGFTSGAGGLDADSYPEWKNYCATYSSASSKTDLIAKWRKAATLTKFVCPVASEEPQQGRGEQRYGYYTNYTVISALETLAENQNDNLGNDMASKDGVVTFRRIPVEYVASLDSESSADPVVGIDWSVFHPVILKGENLREDPARTPSDQPTVSVKDVWLTYNYKCLSRRNNFLLAKAAW